jgi:hypothetical protein
MHELHKRCAMHFFMVSASGDASHRMTPSSYVSQEGQRPLLADSSHSCFGLLRYLKGVVDLDPQIADGALQLAVS